MHVQARRYAAEGYTVVLIGHAGHEEVVGTMGEAPDSIVLVESVEDVAALPFPPDAKLAYITQTTLSVDETTDDHHGAAHSLSEHPRPAARGHLLRHLQSPVGRQGDAPSRRRAAGDRLEELVELNRLVEVARAAGVPAYLIDDESDIDAELVRRHRRPSGVTSGASAPERLVERVCTWFCANGVEQIEPYQLMDEDVTFRLPVELRRELALAESLP